MKTFFFVLLILSLFPKSGTPQGAHSVRGFLKAEDFLHMNTERKEAYAMGIVDGMGLATLFGAPDDGERVKAFGACIVGMSNSQVAAIIGKFLKDHPERWNDLLNAVVFSAMMQGCSQK